MPAKSKSQQRLMAAAEHGASFPMARKLRASMTHDQLHDFSVGSMARKPEHVKPPKAGSLMHAAKHGFPGHPIQNLKHFAHPKRSR